MARLVYAVAASAALCALGPVAWAAEPRARIEGQLEPELKAAIAAAIGATDRPTDNRFEARRRARAAAEDAIAVLRSEGYYAYVVEPDVGEAEAPQAVVRVTPGPRFLIAEPKILWVEPPPDPAAAEAAEAALRLAPGRPGRAADVVGAEGRALAAIQTRGYADARADPREVVVDHADATVRPTFHLVAGSVVRLDGVQLAGGGRTNPRWVAALAPWRTGAVYNPEDVAELERRLLDAGVFDSVTVALAPVASTTADGRRPVVVSLAERKRWTVEAGASYASAEGAGVDARWTRYNRFRRADTLSLYGRASSLDSRVQVELKLPHFREPQQTLTTSAAAYRLRTDAYDENGVGVRADLQRRYGRSIYLTSYRTFGASLDLSRTDELRPGDLARVKREIVTVAGLADLALDRSNDPLDPRTGWRASARAEPTLVAGQVNVPYLKLQTQGSIYLPIGRGQRTVLAARAHAGTMLGGSLDQIPASRRFFAGGGGSVRGFGYQDVGPRLADGTPQGGLSLLELSAEARQDIGRRWGVAAFVDAGAIGGRRRLPGFNDLSVGAGVGVRYNMGFGPIRFDVATPVTNRRGGSRYQIYLSIGQSF